MSGDEAAGCLLCIFCIVFIGLIVAITSSKFTDNDLLHIDGVSEKNKTETKTRIILNGTAVEKLYQEGVEIIPLLQEKSNFSNHEQDGNKRKRRSIEVIEQTSDSNSERGTDFVFPIKIGIFPTSDFIFSKQFTHRSAKGSYGPISPKTEELSIFSKPRIEMQFRRNSRFSKFGK